MSDKMLTRIEKGCPGYYPSYDDGRGKYVPPTPDKVVCDRISGNWGPGGECQVGAEGYYDKVAYIQHHNATTDPDSSAGRLAYVPFSNCNACKKHTDDMTGALAFRIELVQNFLTNRVLNQACKSIKTKNSDK